MDVQHAVMAGGQTDAAEFQRVAGGRHAGTVAVPCRYTHSPVETLSLEDADGTAGLLAGALATPFPGSDDVRR